MSKLFIPSGLNEILEWKEFVPMQEWMEKEVVVSDGGNKGQFDTYRMPHMKRIFIEIDKFSVILITLMSASQVGKTIILINTILKRLDTDPDNSLIFFPKGNQVKKLYENKVKPYIEGCETISKKLDNYIDDTKGTQSSYSKKIAGAILSILDANNTKSVSAKTIGFDEIVEFPPSKVGEGIERSKSFDGKGELAFLASTQHPLKGGDDEINHYYNISEVKLQYWAKCADEKCRKTFYPEPETLVYPTITEWKNAIGLDIDEEAPNITLLSDYSAYVRENSYLQCPHCGNKVDDNERKEQILNDEFEWTEVVPNIIDDEGRVLSWKKAKKPKENYKSVGFDVNTLCIEGYNMGKIAQKIIQDTYGKNKINDLQHTWVGYFNRIYRTKTKTAEPSKILQLSNGLREWIVPVNTAKLYLIIDTQKTHYWWAIYAVEWGRKFNVVSHGKAEDTQVLEGLMFRNYKDENGAPRYIDRVAIDRRGFMQNEEVDADGNKIKSRENTTERIDDFIRSTNIKARKNGIIKRDEHLIIGSMGVPFIKASAKQLEEGSFKGEMQQMVTIEDKSDSQLTHKYLKISNLVAKTEMNEAINNSIENFDSVEDGGEPMILSNLFLINEDMKQYGLNKKRESNEDFEKMLTAEVYDYAVKNGKRATYKSYIPIRRRNDQGDNFATAIALTSLDNIGVGNKPVADSGSGMSMFKKAFKK